jgi:hypothetical protein
MNDYVYLVFSNPVAGKEDEYNQYYDGTHLPELLAIPGLARATRYETAADRPDQDPIEGYAYVCVYEFDDDPIETLDRLGEVRAAGGLTPTDAISRDPGPRAVLFKRRSQVVQ